MLAGRLGNVITSCRHQISNAAAKGLTSKIPARLRLSSDGPAATGTQSASRPSSTSNPVGYGFTHEDSEGRNSGNVSISELVRGLAHHERQTAGWCADRDGSGRTGRRVRGAARQTVGPRARGWPVGHACRHLSRGQTGPLRQKRRRGDWGKQILDRIAEGA